LPGNDLALAVRVIFGLFLRDTVRDNPKSDSGSALPTTIYDKGKRQRTAANPEEEET
jgi:hypothetical protein